MNRTGLRVKKSCMGRFPFHLDSLGKRLTFILVVVATLCISLIGVVSFRSISAIERNRLYTSIMSDAQQINDSMRQEYLSLVHISQQMIPTGSVGSSFEKYLNADNQFDKITLSKLVSENMNLALFTNPSIELVEYITADDPETVLFRNMSDKDGFDPLAAAVLSGTADILFQRIHGAGGRFSNNDVISILRRVTFNDDIDRYIYIEARTNITDSISEMSTVQNIPYSLIQVDSDDTIRYSLLDEFPVGTTFEYSNPVPENTHTGRNGAYIWCQADPIFGFRNILLLPSSYYDREVNSLVRELLSGACIAVGLIFFISFSFQNQFYRPLKILEEEMSRFGRGDMKVNTYIFGVEEYDSLFQQFSLMKTQIGELMDDIYKKEKEKRQLELDKLYYQINPHFIMNALNSAQWQAIMTDRQDLASYLSHLNFLLAYTLGKVSQNTTLRSEIQVLAAYLELQQSRQDFQVHMNIEKGLYLERECARLILQPIAENAICHSINDFGNLWVDAHESEGRGIHISIRDDGSGFDTALLSFKQPPEIGTERQTSNGIGLRYVWLTLDTYYNGKAKMEIESTPGEGTTVSLMLPYQEQEN